MSGRGWRFGGAVAIATILLYPDFPRWVPVLADFWPARHSPFGPMVSGALLIVGYNLMEARSRKARRSEESADSSYFLGFLMTMLFLMFSLMDADTLGSDETWVTTFLRDLGVGLSFTVVGLTMRQIRILGLPVRETQIAPSEAPAHRPAERPSTEPVKAEAPPNVIETQLRRLQELAGRAETVAAAKSDDPNAAKLSATVASFELSVEDATTRLAASLDKLTASSTAASVEVASAASRLRTDLQNDAEGLAREIRQVVRGVQESRETLTALLQATAAEATVAQEAITRAARSQAEEWERHLRESSALLQQARITAESEFRAAFTGLGESSKALVQLGNDILEQARALPNPATRVEAIWSGLKEQEESLSNSLGRASGALERLETTAAGSGRELEQLGLALRDGGKNVDEGAVAMKTVLVKEAADLRSLVDELYAVVEGRINAIGRH